MAHSSTQNSTLPLLTPPTCTISATTRKNRHCIKVHSVFLLLLGMLVFTVILDLNDAFPMHIRIQIDSFSVSSLRLNISDSPNYPSSITGNWNVSLSVSNGNRIMTQSVDKIEFTVRYHGVPLSTGDVTVPFQVRAHQRAPSLADVATTQRVENWVVKNIAGDQIRDDAVSFHITMKTVWSAKKRYAVPFICKGLKVSFNASSGYDHGLVLKRPDECDVWYSMDQIID